MCLFLCVMSVCTYSCGGHRTKQGVFLNQFPPFFCDSLSPLNLEFNDSAKYPASPKTFLSVSPEMESQAHMTTSGLYMGTENQTWVLILVWQESSHLSTHLVSEPLELELWVIMSGLMQVLRTEFESSGECRHS